MRQAALAVLAAAALAGPALAHSWYDAACCSGQDCEPIAVDAVEELRSGDYRVHYLARSGLAVDEVFPRRQVRWSQDGRIHACATPARLVCLYLPANV